MAIFDRNSAKSNVDEPSYGLQENQKESVRSAADIGETFDDELPSVNRRKGGGKFGGKLGYAAIIGAGLLMLYFINTDNTQKVQATKQQEIVNRLPPLEIPEPPQPDRPPPPELKVPPVEQPIPVKQSQPAVNNKPQGPTWLDRRMGGNLVLQTGGSSAGSAGTVSLDAVKNDSATAVDMPTPLALKLKSTVSPGVSANILPDRNYLITKGTALDCALETALDSTVPGMTTCRLTRDIYSDNGHVVLLDRGSQLVGEYQGGITAGQARIFVLWTRAKTPNGVVVSLDSPGADALGRSGHSGWVDRHFMERFGAAILMSLVKDTLRIAQNENQTQFQIGGGGTDQLAVEIMKETAKIPPTLYINQGDHIQIMVARDLDFSSVYGLKLKE
jgi:type IV secretion system protein VirB10